MLQRGAESTNPLGVGPNEELAVEQAYVTTLYERLDWLRHRTESRLESVLSAPIQPHASGALDRDDFAMAYRVDRSRLESVERGLCFGRLDLEPELDLGDRLYIGRVGLMDDDHEPLLVDWRTPAAQRFYRATYADRQGVVRRRHIHTRGRTVTRLDDDVLDLDALGDVDRGHLMGEGALLASLEAGRTGRMSDIVSTIQGEQDRIIRSDLQGILVVEGGPGTGKTVVALHRAAYLLYTHRGRLRRRGVLIVGPNPTFVRYIDQVLPSLGETDVVLATLGELFPGVATGRIDPPGAAVVKGDTRMVDVLTAAVRHRQWVPEEPIEFKIDGDEYRLDPRTCERARQRGRNSGQVHNRARRLLVSTVLDDLTDQGLDQVGRAYAGFVDHAAMRASLAGEPVVHRILDRLWPELTPQRVLADLYADSGYRAAVAADLADADDAALSAVELTELARDEPAAWTVADVPLLDELAVLLGPTDLAVYRGRRAETDRQTEAEADATYAEHIREEAAEAQSFADEEWRVVSDTELIAERYREGIADGSIAERALADREWEFAHTIVDEAQELSPMAWRLLNRRCPGKSMTVVGDVAQTGGADGTGSWAEALDRFAAGRWRLERLSLNYRTPEEIMLVASDLLARTAPELSPPTPVRSGGDPPWTRRVDGDQARLWAEVGDLARDEHERTPDGTVAVIVPSGDLAEAHAAIRSAVPEARGGGDRTMLDAPVAVLTPKQAKGLEFDAVLVVDPDAILEASQRGAADLYVALTRATRRLGVVHRRDLPTELRSLAQE